MEYVWKSWLWSVYFKELHNDQEYYWLTIYRAGAVQVLLTLTLLLVNVLTTTLF